ncbi:methyltransferase domain-containing protein [Thermodesulfobacteriota bacterium]
MHPKVYQEFERICRDRNGGGAVLEIGAMPSDESLLCMESLQNVTEKIGINLDGPYCYKDFEILKVNANAMDCFKDNSFDTVLCNSVLEHDKFFWKTISEIKRVTKSKGLVVIGTPGYTLYRIEKQVKKTKSKVKSVPALKKVVLPWYLSWILTGTLTLRVHNHPGDYYRFSPQAFKEVFFEGMKDVHIATILLPPRIIGSGIIP